MRQSHLSDAHMKPKMSLSNGLRYGPCLQACTCFCQYQLVKHCCCICNLWSTFHLRQCTVRYQAGATHSCPGLQAILSGVAPTPAVVVSQCMYYMLVATCRCSSLQVIAVYLHFAHQLCSFSKGHARTCCHCYLLVAKAFHPLNRNLAAWLNQDLSSTL